MFGLREFVVGVRSEHACVRCPMLQVDPAQLPRLQELETNAIKRLSEAKEKTWLGEVAALKESLRHIREKQVQAVHINDRVRDGAEFLPESRSGR